jgi:hypothetical protein
LFQESPQLRAFSLINNKKEFKMVQKLKHLKYFSNYIAEQDFAADVPVDGATPAPQKEPIYSVLFIEKGDEGGDYTYPDGSSSKRYSTYQIRKDELTKWVDKNVVEKEGVLSKSAVKVKKESLIDYISGIKDNVTPDDKEFVEKFKNAIQTGMEGKQIQDTEVIFSPKHKVPSTDSVDVTFIITDK